MKIAILETVHYQYALTKSEIFSDCNKIFITTTEMRKGMEAYAPELCVGDFFEIDSIEKNAQDIIAICKEQQVDWLLISPVFDSFGSLNKLLRKITCKKILTTHNINTWFNGRFWSPNSYMDRVNMRGIIKQCDFIAVEDFIYNYLKESDHPYFRKHRFIYIPFTIFQQGRIKTFQKTDNRMRVVLTGAIDANRRRYEHIIEVITHFAKKKSRDIIFSFAGKAMGDHGKWVHQKLDELNAIQPGISEYFNQDATPEDFKREMEIADFVLSASNLTFKGMGTTEYIGKTKPTAAIHDMMSYELPGLLPAHLKVPEKLKGSVFNYKNTQDIIDTFEELLLNKQKLNDLKQKASENSLNFIASEIRKDLPF